MPLMPLGPILPVEIPFRELCEPEPPAPFNPFDP